MEPARQSHATPSHSGFDLHFAIGRLLRPATRREKSELAFRFTGYAQNLRIGLLAEASQKFKWGCCAYSTQAALNGNPRDEKIIGPQFFLGSGMESRAFTPERQRGHGRRFRGSTQPLAIRAELKQRLRQRRGPALRRDAETASAAQRQWSACFPNWEKPPEKFQSFAYEGVDPVISGYTVL